MRLQEGSPRVARFSIAAIAWIAGLAGIAAMAGCHGARAVAPADETPESLHRGAIVIDTHNDVTQRLVIEQVNLGDRLADGQTDLPRMREGGLDGEFLSVFVPPKLYPGEKAYTQALAELDAIDTLVATHSGTAVLARTAGEVAAAAAGGKVAFLIGVEGGHSLGDATDAELLQRLDTFYRRGARYMTLTWSNSNRLGGSSGDDGRGRGLTPFGQRVVAAMNDLGMMVDISHVSDATFFDAVRVSRLPVIASHSSARALADRPRNMSDDMLRAVRDNGGAVCVNFGPEFLDAEWAKKLDAAEQSVDIGAMQRDGASDPRAAQLAIWRKFKETAARLPPVPAARVVDHIEHIARVAGVDHVCLGSDFDGVPAAPAGLEDVSKLPFLTRELLRRGFPPDDVRKILGQNVLRVMNANERGRAAAR
ncbi:MAG: dipeptidase [Myxococcota bacterium]|nr:dipeptidase [Myxococcota bacterium]